ncbi:MAG: hypothetical protein ACLFQV_02105 [Vulcanimicrobiota bacterium]
MTIVKGPAERFYDVPQNILEQYVLSDKQIRKMRTRALKLSIDEVEDQDVEGYGSFLFDYEGFGYICGLPHNLEK